MREAMDLACEAIEEDLLSSLSKAERRRFDEIIGIEENRINYILSTVFDRMRLYYKEKGR